MQRINVVGVSGSGKSSFSRQLAAVLDIPYIEMDALYWQPDWVESATDEFVDKVAQAVSADAWVLDGNYHSKTRNIKWRRADTVIWLDYSFNRTLWQILRRSVLRAFSRKELWAGTGNVESIRRNFFSKQSVVWWMISNYARVNKRYRQIIASPPFPHLHIIHLTHPRQARHFLANIKPLSATSSAITATE